SQFNGHLEGHPLREANGFGGQDVSGDERAKPNGRLRLNGNGRVAGALRPRFSTDDLAVPARRPASTPQTRQFRRRFFPEVPDRDCNDWRWQSRHRVRTLEQIERMLKLADDEREALVQGGTMLPVGITPYYMSLLSTDDPLQPLRRTVIPTKGEFVHKA